jgi:acyl-CoA synthetase (AMP-forming)/AMP-acid ligase II/acyl carrier protein
MGLGTASFTDAWVRRLELGQTGGHPDADNTAFVFLADGEVEHERLTFIELYRRVAAAAEVLLERAAPGERAILLYPSGTDFIVAFLACLAARIVPVPVSAPHPKTGLAALRAIALDSGATLLLSTSSLLSKYQPKMAADALLAQLDACDTSGFPVRPVRERMPDGARAEDVALLQYTSGSTGSPRGVVVTHANLIQNHRELEHGFGTDSRSVIASWLPMFHDMGLGTVLHGPWLGVPCILMSPAAFLQKPVRWLRAISRYGATVSGGPDFAYDLCARRVIAEEKCELDLRSWRAAYDGSEPIRAEVVQRFIREFAACGFRPEVFHPVYGLAEATLMVSAKAPLEPNAIVGFSRSGLARGEVAPPAPGDGERGVELVGCGNTWLDTRVAIVDPDTHGTLPDGKVGEIWVQGPSVTAGYWGKPEETRATFEARTSDGQGPFLRTGDLGSLHGGQLFITGRRKDLVIIRGKNHYPQDLEATASSCHPALEPQRAAAVALPREGGAGERLLVVQEVRRTALAGLDAAQVFEALRSAIAREHGVSVDTAVLIAPATLPRTTSGKVRRRTCLLAYLDGSLTIVAESALSEPGAAEPLDDELPPPSGSLESLPRSIAPRIVASGALAPGSIAARASRQGTAGQPPRAEVELTALRHRVESHVLTWVARRAKVPQSQVDPRASLSGLGIDSLARVDLVHSLEKLLEVSVSESDLHAVDSLAELIALAVQLCAGNSIEAPSFRPEAQGLRQEAAAAAPSSSPVALPRFTPIKWH